MKNSGSKPTPVQQELGRQFRALHTGGELLVLGNAWDVASALLLQDLGFRAIGTTSLGIAAAYGLRDGCDESGDRSLQMAERMAAVLRVPLSVDMERGSGASPSALAASIRGVIAAGAVGVNLEDGIGGATPRLEDVSRQTELIARARTTADETGLVFTINARTDALWLRTHEGDAALKESIRRAQAYCNAGADCIFVPGTASEEALRMLVREIPAPINVLAVKGLPPLQTLRDIGIRRLSLGSAPYRRAMAALRDAARRLIHDGDPEELFAGIPYAEINALAARRP